MHHLPVRASSAWLAWILASGPLMLLAIWHKRSMHDHLNVGLKVCLLSISVAVQAASSVDRLS